MLNKIIPLLIIFIFIACESNKHKSNAENTMVIGVTKDVDTFNPLYGESVLAQELTHLMLLGLADLNDRSEFQPELATHWESSPDHLQLTYFLRDDVHWSDGIKFSAYDVAFTWDLIMDTTVASPRQSVAEYVSEVSAVDSFTVTFTFKEAYPAQIFDTAGEILPRHILEGVERKELRTHQFGRNPVATGPFKLKRWESQQFIELVPNPKYFGTPAKLNKVVFKIVPNTTNLLSQLQTGEVDMVPDVPHSEIERLKSSSPSLDFHRIQGRVYYYIGYNYNNDLFQSRDIRKALTMAIDRQKIIDALLYGYGSPCSGPIPKMIAWAHNDELKMIPFEPQQSKRIFASEGWKDSNANGVLDKNGREFEFDLVTAAGNPIKTDAATVVQSQLAQIGVKMNIKVVEWTKFIELMRSHEFDAALGGLSASYYIDPTPLFHSTATSMFNSIGYSNSEVDRLIESGREEMDQQQAAKIWKEFQRIIYADNPYTYLFWKDKIAAVNKKFENVTPIALSSVYDLEKWAMK